MSGEDDFIARHFAPLAGPGAFGLRDDAALIAPPPGCQIVVTADAIVAGVHFLADDPPGDIARKALRVNLSDLAAKGAKPLGFVLTLALPTDFADTDVAAFAAALGEDARNYGAPLLGGDTVSTPGPLTVSITAFGSVPAGRMVLRGGAKAGDVIYVTGTIGDAALGLLALRGDSRLASLTPVDRDILADRYRRPQPRNALTQVLRDHASAAMDVSDGLAGDLTKMLALAGLSAEIPLSAIPLCEPARKVVASSHEIWSSILAGGDDYEILCSMPEDEAPAFETAARAAGIRVTRLGAARVLSPSSQVNFTDKNGRAFRLDRLSYSHV